MASQRYKTALEFIQAFETLSDPPIRSPDCIQTFAPASLNIPSKNNEAFTAHMQSLKKLLASFPVAPKQIIENEKENQVVVWATSEARIREELKDEGLSKEDWTYYGEYIFILTLDETGKKITHILEFLDSKGTDRLRGLMARAKRNLEALEA